MTRKWLFALTLAFLFPSRASAQTACPPDHPASRGWPTGYLRFEDFADHRALLGLDGLSAGDVRLLVDATDLQVCQRLSGMFGADGSHTGWRWAAYQVGRFYMVAFRNTDPHRLILTPMYIFDQNFVQVGGFVT